MNRQKIILHINKIYESMVSSAAGITGFESPHTGKSLNLKKKKEEEEELNESFKIKNTYHEGKKVWYAETLMNASKGLPVKNLPITNKLLDTKIEWTLNTFFDFKNHLERIKNCDLKYPVIVGPKGHIIDGYHRLMKAVMLNHKTIKYVKLDKMPPHDFME